MIAKILGSIYLCVIAFFCVWYIVFSIGLWMSDLKAKRRMRLARATEKPAQPVYDIVGKSTTVFLAPLTPVMSEDLVPELQTALEPEPDIIPGEVETHLNHSVMIADDEPDAYHDGDMEELSQGLTFEQISHAVEVIEGKKSDEKDEYFAGETLSIMPDDFLNMICMQENYDAKVKKLIAGYLDFPGKMKPVPVVVTNFDINKYV
jgi:hypothetical protein